MLRIALANLRAHKGRLLLSSLAIVLATAFVAGAFVFTDAMRSALFGSFTQDLGQADVVVTASNDADVSSEALSTVQGVDGVAGAEHRITARMPLRTGDRFEPAKVVSVAADSASNWPEVAQGRMPQQPGEALLDRATAQRRGLSPGDTIHVPLDYEGSHATSREAEELRLVGLVEVGTSPTYSGMPFIGVTAEQAQELTDEYLDTQILASATEGVSPAELAERTADAVGSAYRVRTAEEHAQYEIAADGRAGGTTAGLLSFAGIALFVAAIVIANTFSILLAQRTREMALLRCVGASRRQVFGSVLGESAVLGLAASALGVLTGYGLASGVGAALTAAFPTFPFGAITLSATAVAIPLALGAAVTVGAALLPARAATRIPPVAALRDQAVTAPTRRSGRIRLAFAVLAVLAGSVGLALGTLVLSGTEAFVAAFVGGAVAFLGVLLASPALIPPLVRLVGIPLGRPLGMPGRLAAVNAVRNPRRATATTTALLVGVTLITMMSVGASSLRATVNAQMDEEFPVDYMVRSSTGNIPASVAQDIRDIPGIAEVAVIRGTTTQLGGDEAWVSGVDPQELAAVTSQLPQIAQVDRGEVVVSEKLANQLEAGRGDTIRLGDGGNTAELTVAGILTTDQGPSVAYTTRHDLQRIFPEATVAGVYAQAAPEADLVAITRAIDSATVGISATVTGTAKTEATYTEVLDTALLVFTALLAVAVLIAVVGIANTLALSVIERTRESALLRALGLTRVQLRAMLAIEAGLLAVVGALVGVGLGTFFGWAGLTSLLGAQFGIVLDVPGVQLALLIAAAVVAGLLASVLPGRRAARASVVSALADE